MTKRERVMAAIMHQQPDRVPKGELAIDRTLREKLLADQNVGALPEIAREVRVRELLGIDVVNVHEYPSQLVGYDRDGSPLCRGVMGEVVKVTPNSTVLYKPALEDIEDAEDYEVPDISRCTTNQLDYYKKYTDFFLFTQISGPISTLDWMLGMEDYCCYCMEDPENVALLARKAVGFEIRRAKKFIDHGADGILMADDMAFNQGLILPPKVMDQVAYPIYKEAVDAIKAYKDVPVFLHTDGNINAAMDSIVACGFDGLQSLQPSAGMDLAKIKEMYGDRLCLMGNIDLDYLLPFGTEEEVRRETRKTIEIGNQNGGFILSTCNILTDIVKPENALAMYRAAEEI